MKAAAGPGDLGNLKMKTNEGSLYESIGLDDGKCCGDLSGGFSHAKHSLRHLDNLAL
jgi:hypothetical protein